ncbi:hypothetical protein ABVK25_005216 [Lepraria finkii]|uniref:Uncharacterized protein n=1 Tax=Lepraria finkii TaxID=1340010 RepID=A0ABR4BAM4_9LECA
MEGANPERDSVESLLPSPLQPLRSFKVISNTNISKDCITTINQFPSSPLALTPTTYLSPPRIPSPWQQRYSSDPTIMELVQEFLHFIWIGIKFFAFIGAVILVSIAIGGLIVLAVLGVRNGIWALID